MAKSLLDILIEGKYLSQDQADWARKEAETLGDPIDSILLRRNLVKEEILYEAKAKLLGLLFFKLGGRLLPSELLQELPEDAAKKYGIVPLARKEGFLDIGMINPEDIESQEAAKFLAVRQQLEPRIFLLSPADFKEALKQFRGLKREVKIALKELEKEFKRKPGEARAPTEEEIERIVEEAPITKVVAVILRHAVEGRASDIHIEPGGKQLLKVRFRVDGVLYTSLFLPVHVHPAVVSRIKILSNLKIDETRIPQDGRFSTEISGRRVDFRISTFPTTNGEKVAIRVLDPAAGLMTLPQLGLKDRNLKVLEENIKKPYGMILITGPTGCGKTTTQYAILKVLNQDVVNIVSLEDPVEYYIEGINQSQVNPEIGYDFAQGLRHVVRQDPDIIMVGEIRDSETAALATHAALTGHIVLSTLHTNNAIGIIPRLIDMGVDPFLIPASLNLGIAQRLVRRLCDDCKKKFIAPPKAEKIILEELEKLPAEYKNTVKISKPIEIYRASGCEKCLQKGMKGRVAIFEILAMTSQLERIIIEAPSEVNIIKEAGRQGMITMRQDGILKALQGVTSLEEVLRAAE